MPRTWRNRLILALGLAVLSAGLGYRLCRPARSAPDDDERTPPTVTAGPAQPRLPEDYPVDDVEMFGQELAQWEDGPYSILEYHGEFRLDFAKRRLSANDALVWVRSEKIDGKEARHFTVYLDGSVRIAEIGGTVLRARRQIVTFETTGRIWTNSAAKVKGGSDSAFFKKARAFRDRSASSSQPAIEPEEAPASQPARRPRPTSQPKWISYGADRTTPLIRGEERVILAEGNVYISRSVPTALGGDKVFMEIQADRGVFYANEAKLQESMARSTSQPDMGETVTGAYLEGAVKLRRGTQTIDASRLYYDLEHDRALILDAVLFQPNPTRHVPTIVWADRIRELSAGNPDPKTGEPRDWEMKAYNARLTSSEMNTPQYDIKAREIYLKTEGRPDGTSEMFYKTHDEYFEIRGVPVAWSPGSEGTADSGETALRTIRTGSGKDLGAFIDVSWNAYKLLNLPPLPGTDATLHTAYYGDRGPSVSLLGNWKKDDDVGYGIAHGVLDSGWKRITNQNGNPNLMPLPDNSNQSQNELEGRGRLLIRDHRYLKYDWELIEEVSLLSDRDFLRDWYRPEYDTGKEQETLLYLKKNWDDNAFTVLVKPKIDTFLNQAEKLPEVKYYKLGEPLWNDRLVYFSENSAGLMDYSVDDQRVDRKDSGLLGRIDTRHEFQAPFNAGPVKIVPYVTLRLTDWTQGAGSMATGTPTVGDPIPGTLGSSDSGGTAREFGAVGVNSSMTFNRVYNDVENRFLDIHRMRHIVEPVLYVHGAGDNVDRNKLVPLDPGVEGVGGWSAVDFGIHQRWQTKRGGPGEWRNVDWMRLDIDIAGFTNNANDVAQRTWFEPEATRPPGTRPLAIDSIWARGEYDPSRPENSLAMSTFNWYYEWRASDTTTLMWDGNYGQDRLDRNNFGVSIQRSPRWRMYFGDRYIAALNTNDLLFQSQYKINRKYDFLFSIAYDTTVNKIATTEISLIRKVQRWYVAATFDLSNIQKDQTIMLTVWPEGAPELTMGDDRISQPGTTTTSTRAGSW